MSLTPKTLLSLPRPGIARPSPSGAHFLISSSTYSFDSSRTARQLHVGHLPTSSPTATTPKCKPVQPQPEAVLKDLLTLDALWLDAATVLYVRKAGAAKDEGDHLEGVKDADREKAWQRRARARGVKEEDVEGEGVELWAKKVIGEDGEKVLTDKPDKDYGYVVGQIPVSIGDLKLLPLPTTSLPPSSTSSALLAFSASAYSDGNLADVAARDAQILSERSGTDARVYDSTFIRHWDTWAPSEPTESISKSEVEYGKKSTQVFVVGLRKGEDGQWKLEGEVIAPLKNTGLETPIAPFGGDSDFDLSPTHLVFHAKDPSIPLSWHTRAPIYLVPLHPKNADEAKPRKITTLEKGLGATENPVFSWSAKQGKEGKIAWLEMRKDGYESDRNRVVVYDIATESYLRLTEDWDRSPKSITWSEDDTQLFLTAEDVGYDRLFSLPIPTSTTSASSQIFPTVLTDKSAVHGVHLIPKRAETQSSKDKHPHGQLLLTINSLTTNSEIVTLKISSPGLPVEKSADATAVLASFISEEIKSNLAEGEEFWFEGAEGHKVHGFIMRPAEARNQKTKGVNKWPLAFLIHGGPQGAWTDSWSTRWNPNIWVAAGYIVVTINPTGSTGYGQDFTDRINQNWGGRPFKDLQAGYKYVLDTYEEVDAERTVALGASYGGYMVNWIQGHNDVFGFKALVCHDGIFNTKDTWYATEELYFPEHDLGGTPWEVPSEYEKWNPEAHITNWNTPELIIHGGRDYRLPEPQGIAVFNVLQRRGVPSRLLYFPSENHWVLNARNSLVWHEEILRWMKEWVGEEREGYRVAYDA